MSKWLWRVAWLLVPAAWAAHHYLPAQAVLAFSLACLSLMPLAKAMGDATEELAERLGPAAGSLLNSTFGNAAELILAIAALRAGHVDLVKGSITGSILGNLLLVAGGAIVVGGIRRPVLRFSSVAAGASVSTLFLAVVALATPALLGRTGVAPARAVQLSESISVVLLIMYALALLFTLRTGERIARDAKAERDAKDRRRAPEAAAHDDAVGLATHHEPKQGEVPHGPAWKPVAYLCAAAVATAIASEVLVAALEGTLHQVHLPEAFVGVVIIAIVGNAAEHSTALIFAWRGEMDVALGIAWESSKQIALFVAPVLVLLGAAMGVPMDLSFSALEVAGIAIAVIATALISLDGQTHWLEGAFLLAVYALLAIGFWFVT
jgi:Ca2+:H+ antiporter